MSDEEITEYRVRGPQGLSGRGSAILNRLTYPHTREQADRALNAERDYIRHDNLIDDHHAIPGYRQGLINEITLEERTVTPWTPVAPTETTEETT